MMDALYDPIDTLFTTTETIDIPSNDFLFPQSPKFDDFNYDPTADLSMNPEMNFDMDLFQSFLDQLMSNETSAAFDASPSFSSSSSDSSESEPTTREIGTDPMVDATPPPTIQTTKILNTVPTKTLHQLLNGPIIIIQTGTKLPSGVTTETTLPPIEYPIENSGTITPSPSNHSADEASPSSPDVSNHAHTNNMITNLSTLPKSGPLILTNEELKLMKQEGYTIPTTLPLSKNDEKMLKRIQRKIKNKLSAQDSRRKKKEYVETLEKQMAKIVDENNALKERIANIEKSHRTLAQERDTLRSLISKGNPGQSTVLMALVLFFAVLFGIWSPITNKSTMDDRLLAHDLALVPSSSFRSNHPKPSFEHAQNESPKTNPLSDSYKSRVLLSIDEQQHQEQYGPYLPSTPKSKVASSAAAPGYTYAKTVERYMNKKIRPAESDEMISVKKARFNPQPQEKVVILEEPVEQGLNENKSVKIIRVERTVPAVNNDTLKLARRMANE